VKNLLPRTSPRGSLGVQVKADAFERRECFPTGGTPDAIVVGRFEGVPQLVCGQLEAARCRLPNNLFETFRMEDLGLPLAKRDADLIRVGHGDVPVTLRALGEIRRPENFTSKRALRVLPQEPFQLHLQRNATFDADVVTPYRKLLSHLPSFGARGVRRPRFPRRRIAAELLVQPACAGVSHRAH